MSRSLSLLKCKKVLLLIIGTGALFIISTMVFQWETPAVYWNLKNNVANYDNDNSDTFREPSFHEKVITDPLSVSKNGKHISTKVPKTTKKPPNYRRNLVEFDEDLPEMQGVEKEHEDKDERTKNKLVIENDHNDDPRSKTATKKLQEPTGPNVDTADTTKDQTESQPEATTIPEDAAEPEPITEAPDPPEEVTDEPTSDPHTNSSTPYACTVPKLDPWDKLLRHLIDHYPPNICKKIQPDLMYIDDDNYLRLNDTELSRINLTSSDVECVYMTIERGNQEEDFQAHLGYTKSFIKPIQIEKDIVQVNCVLKTEGQLLYGEVLTYPVLDKTKKVTKTNENILNVIMIFIDSVSLSAMQRHMPKTFQYMVKNMGFRIMAGYNKVADNSFPNLIPMLTGKRVHNQQPDMLDEFEEDTSKIYFDHWPLIWKNFSSRGYITTFNEEYPDMGLFHLNSFGFRQKPVDHFYINYWKALEWMTYPKTPTKDCYGNRTPAQVLLDIIRNHLRKFKNYAQFMYNYLIWPAHSDSAQLEKIDHYYLEFFQDMHAKEAFNKSFVIFLSDHGHRNSPIRTTTVGLLEERLPVCMLYFPPWFYRKYPKIDKNLRLNHDRLASNFDIYETLIDILRGNFKSNSRQRPASSRGQSLLHPIRPDRSCRSAGIPFYFCTCQQMKWRNIPTTSSLAKYAGADFMFSLNDIVQKNELCARWTLKELIQAEIMDISSNDAGVTRNTTLTPAAVVDSDVYKTNLQLVRVTVRGEVSFINGTFQALMLFNKDQHMLSLHSDIGRLDRYGNQSYCIGNDANSQMKKLCVCRSIIS